MRVTTTAGLSQNTPADNFTYVAAPSHTRYEQTDTRIRKTGAWSNYAKPLASGGSYGRSTATNTSATIYFNGTRLDWMAMKGTSTGIAEVYVDGVWKARSTFGPPAPVTR